MVLCNLYKREKLYRFSMIYSCTTYGHVGTKRVDTTIIILCGRCFQFILNCNKIIISVIILLFNYLFMVNLLWFQIILKEYYRLEQKRRQVLLNNYLLVHILLEFINLYYAKKKKMNNSKLWILCFISLPFIKHYYSQLKLKSYL